MLAPSNSDSGRTLSLRRRKRSRAISLLELLLTITIILVLTVIVAARYERSVDRSREAAARQDRWIRCNAVAAYEKDTGTAPNSFDELVKAKYLSGIPAGNFSIQACGDEYFDPVRTTPGLGNIYSRSLINAPVINR